MQALERRAPAARPAVPREEPRRRPRHAAVAGRPDGRRTGSPHDGTPTWRPRPTISSERDGCSRSVSAGRRATSPSKTRRDIATPSASPLPVGVPEALLAPAPDPLGNLVKRYARTHAPFGRRSIRRPVRARNGRRGDRRWCGSLATVNWPRASSRRALRAASGLTPACSRQLRRRSLARLRHEIEPVEQAGPRTARRRAGRASPGAGTAPMRCSMPSSSSRARPLAGVHPRNRDPSRPDRRIRSRRSRRRRVGRRSRLDGCRAAGRAETGASRYTWPISCHGLLPPQGPVKRHGQQDDDARETAIVEFLRTRGASYFGALHDAGRRRLSRRDGRGALAPRCGSGVITNDTFHAPSRVSPARTRAGAPATEGRARALPFAPPRATIG